MYFSVYSVHFNSHGSESLRLVDSGYLEFGQFVDFTNLTKSYCQKVTTFCCEFIDFYLSDSSGKRIKLRFKPAE